MIKIITSERLPIKMWLDEIEADAMKQAVNLANLPFAFKHIAIMPDAHVGFGMPIGGVLATKGFVIPNAVGVDIGCGMCAMRSSLRDIDKKTLQNIIDLIKLRIPVGFKHHNAPADERLMPKGYRMDEMPVISREYQSALCQIGTLGGGNHFIEIQRGNDGYIWVMLHSGSRNLGKQVADYYNRMAKELAIGKNAIVERSKDLSPLAVGTQEAFQYMQEMRYCVEFALANRRLMMDVVKECFCDVCKEDVVFDPLVNIAHNYAHTERHFDSDVIVHRKGATSARKGEIGIIPGSQGSKSYIVEGLGNVESFMSCSHGAGRKMGRKQAQRTLDIEKEQRLLDEKGIIHALRSGSDLDEAPGAYKDIDEVMNNQSDLVKIKVELLPLAVVKG